MQPGHRQRCVYANPTGVVIDLGSGNDTIEVVLHAEVATCCGNVCQVDFHRHDDIIGTVANLNRVTEEPANQLYPLALQILELLLYRGEVVPESTAALIYARYREVWVNPAAYCHL